MKWILFCFFFLSGEGFGNTTRNRSIIGPDSNGAYILNEELSKGGEKETGISTGGIFKLESGQILRVKEKTQTQPKKNSLIISYIGSRLLQFIVPGQVATIFVVNHNGSNLIGSYDIPSFEPKAAKNPENNVDLLNLALDLMDISDSHEGNLGSAEINGIKKSVAVDIDLTNEFIDPWLIKENTLSFLAKAEPGSNEREALAKMSHISKDEIRKIFLMEWRVGFRFI